MNLPRDFEHAEAERLRRMKNCFDADRPDEAEVLNAFRRWNHATTENRPRMLLRPEWVIASLILLSGVAMAASGTLKLPSWASLVSHSRPAQPDAAPAVSLSRPYFVERAGIRNEYRQPSQFSLLPGERATLIVGDARTEFVGPGVAQIQLGPQATAWVTRFEPQDQASERGSRESTPAASNVPPERLAPEPAPPDNSKAARPASEALPKLEAKSVRALDEPAAVPTGSSSVSRLEGAWSRAASAMRRGDEVTASGALNEISHSADPAARDAALLAQAQLDLAAGRRAKAMPVLSELSRNGATAFVRQRAQEIVAHGE